MKYTIPSDLLFESVDNTTPTPSQVMTNPAIEAIANKEKDPHKRKFKKIALYGGLAAASLGGGVAGRTFAAKVAPKLAGSSFAGSAMGNIAAHPNVTGIVASGVPKAGFIAGLGYEHHKNKKMKKKNERI